MISQCALLDVFWGLKWSCHAKLTSVTSDFCLGWGTHSPLCCSKPGPDSGNWKLSRNVPENISPPGPIMGPCAGRQVFLVERGNYVLSPFTFLFVVIVAIEVAHLQMFHWVSMNAFVRKFTLWNTNQQSIDIHLSDEHFKWIDTHWALISNHMMSSLNSDADHPS